MSRRQFYAALALAGIGIVGRWEAQLFAPSTTAQVVTR